MVIRFLKVVFLGLWTTLSQAQEYNFSLQWVNNQAQSISISNLASTEFQVRLEGSKTDIIGKITTQDKLVTFVPALTFTNDPKVLVVRE